MWKIERERYRAMLILTPYEALTDEEQDVLAVEGEALLRFVEPDAQVLDVIGKEPAP